MTDLPPSPPKALAWQTVAIVAVATVTPRIRSCTFRVEGFERFRAGQSVTVRLTAPDGYQAQRSYSIASSPSALPFIELLIERLEHGEVSSFFHDAAEPGDAIELRGPIGGALTWAPGDGGPILLAGGGSGLVPLLSMLRHRRAVAARTPATLLYSVRSAAEAIALDELTRDADLDPSFRLMLALTRGIEEAVPSGARARRIDRAMVEEALSSLPAPPRHAFVCGSTAFVGTVADLLVDAGLSPTSVRTERFG